MKQIKKGVILSAVILIVSLLITACSANQQIDDSENNNTSAPVPTESRIQSETENPPEKTGVIAEQILNADDSEIHYSYYLPEGYDESKAYPLVMTMPGYGMMWFGEESSGSNLEWNGFLVWTELPEDMIVVSAQLTDWHETSARQAIELTEYFIENFSVDKSRVYAAGYSAGGETMSQAVSMRPDLYEAYLHGASQWDGAYEPIAQNDVAIYIFMAENDEYYGSEKARSAYVGLQAAYREKGYTDEQIGELLILEIPDNEYFNSRGIYNYHGGGNVVFDDETVLNWILSRQKNL
ncbi:MAG: prolyl oligopeptidase family serine peptidase [Oscillospiraceae bacterium]